MAHWLDAPDMVGRKNWPLREKKETKIVLTAIPGQEKKYDNVMLSAVKATAKERELLQKMGVRSELIDWILIQDWMESGGYQSRGFTENNNPGNIYWNKYDKWGTKGSYNAKDKQYWSRYPNLNAYLKKKMEVLSQAPGRPVDATSGEDFVNRLAKNHYFWPAGVNDIRLYIDAMKGAAQRMNIVSMLQDDTNQDIVIPGAAAKDGLPWWQWGLIGMAGVYVFKKVTE